MGRVESGGRRTVLTCAMFATLMAALQPAFAQAQPTAEVAGQPAAPTSPEAAAPAAAPPARKPWREAMERAPAAESEAPSERVWYGWQTLLLDLSGVGLIALFAEAGEFGVAGLIVLGLGSPIVHFAHGNTSAGLISFGIRAASIGLLFLGGALLADGIFDDDDFSDDDTTEVIGTVAAIASVPGALTAVIIDASLLAFDERRREPQRSSLTPWFDPRRGSYGVRFSLWL